MLEALGVENRGLVAGTPRVERGDEFGWHTPLLQMSIRSEFERHDRTPPYFEDLRTLYALPITDWGLAFKPQLWMFHIASPAAAYSFYHYFMISMFIIGFTLLLIRLGGNNFESLFGALALFFAAYTQYWWNAAANFFFPFFPWIVLSLLLPIRLAWRLLIFYWLIVCGLLTYFYPPNAIALGFVGFVLIVSLQPALLRPRRLALLALTAGAAVATSVFYLRDALRALADTVYPGQRVNAGGGLGFDRWLSQLVPTSQIDGHTSLVAGINVGELATLGSVYVLAIACFFPWREFTADASRSELQRLAPIAVGLIATQAWMMISLPAWAGYPLLWHRVPPGRMVLAGGLLLVLLAFLLGHTRPLRFTWLRLATFGTILLLVWTAYKRPHGIDLLAAWRDWAILAPVAVIAFLVHRGSLSPKNANGALLASAAVLAAASFGNYNPIQSADPIFARHETPVTRDLERRLRVERRGYLVLPWGSSFFAHTGLPLVGLGYPSITYSTFAPALDFWRRLYPELPPDEFDNVFNNVGGFSVGDVAKPSRVPGTLVTLAPVAPFEQKDLTVCDLITDRVRPFAHGIGCRDTRAGRP